MNETEMNAVTQATNALKLGMEAFLLQQRMIEYLAKKAWKHGFGKSLPDSKYCRKLNDEACDYECWRCWMDEAYDKAVNHAE